jgi:preprotein translocase subunit SecG
VVLLQRNEGAAWAWAARGRGRARARPRALARATWWLGGGFMAMSLALTMIAAREAGESSVVDQIQSGGASEEAASLPDLGGRAACCRPSRAAAPTRRWSRRATDETARAGRLRRRGASG